MIGVPLSGQQFEIRYGDQRATIVEVGGGIRAYEVGGRPVLDPYPLESMCDGAHGAPLIPWPNRLGDGQYRFDGVDYQVPLTEPDKRNYDFRDGKRLGDLRLDFPFTDLSRDSRGRAWVRLCAPDGSRSELWVDEHYPIVELFTGDTLAPHRRRRGIGAEPMTCPPDAFQSGDHLIRLDPEQSVTTRWGARIVTP